MAENKSATKKKRRSPPKKLPAWDQSKALDLAQKGVNQRDIASALNLHVNTIHRFLARVKPEIEQIGVFETQTSNVLALTLSRCCSILDRLLIHFDNEDVIRGLTLAEKSVLLSRVAIITGISFDKWRLASGKSTANNSHEIQIKAVHLALDFNQPSSEEAGRSTDHTKSTDGTVFQT